MITKREVWSKEKHYHQALVTLVDIGADYDGYDTKSAESMRELVDDLISFAKSAANCKPIWINGTTGKPAYKIR